MCVISQLSLHKIYKTTKKKNQKKKEEYTIRREKFCRNKAWSEMEGGRLEDGQQTPNTRTSTVAAAQPWTDISRTSAALMLCWGQGDGEQLQACTKGIPVYSEVCEPGCEPESLPLSWLRGPLRLNGRSEFEGANGSERVMERDKIWTSSDGYVLITRHSAPPPPNNNHHPTTPLSFPLHLQLNWMVLQNSKPFISLSFFCIPTNRKFPPVNHLSTFNQSVSQTIAGVWSLKKSGCQVWPTS